MQEPEQLRIDGFVEAEFSTAEAAKKARDGMERALRAERVAAWKKAATYWVTTLDWMTTFTADDLVAAVGLPDRVKQGQDRNNVIGALFSSLSKQKQIEFTGTLVPSARPERHGNLQRQWRRT